MIRRRTQRLIIKIDAGQIREGHSTTLSSSFLTESECGEALDKIQAEASNGKVSLPATVRQATVLKLASDGSNSCEGGEQEIVFVAINEVMAYDAIVDVEQKLDCPAGLNAQWIQNINGVIFILHSNSVPTAPKM